MINENFVVLNWNGILVPRYQISNYGRIYDDVRKKYYDCHDYKTDKDGYYLFSIIIQLENEVKYQRVRVHRVELMSFNFIPNFKQMEVNHKDGNKQNLLLDNLEWMTPIENTRHGWDTGLNNNIGINNGNGRYSDDVIHKICQLLDKKYSNAEICDELGIFEKDERMRFSAVVSSVKLGKTHRYISSEYSFLSGVNVSNRYTLDFAHLVCNFLSDPNHHYTYKEIMDFLNIPNEERANFRIYINDLLRKRTAKSVVELYDVKKPLEGNDDLSFLMR